MSKRQIMSCASKCAASIEFGKSCKTCGKTMNGFEFGVKDPADRCYFCPKDDILYPDRVVPFFSIGGEEIKCWQVQTFFDTVEVDKNSENCQLAQGQNYICG